MMSEPHLLFTHSTGPSAVLNAAATDCTAGVRSLALAVIVGPCMSTASSLAQAVPFTCCEEGAGRSRTPRHNPLPGFKT